MLTCRTDAPSIVARRRMGQCCALRRGSAVLLLGALLAACSAPVPVRAPAPTVAAAPATVHVTSTTTAEPGDLVIAERNAAVARDLTTLASLWDADAVIRETCGNPGPDDDYVWRGREAILDRYKVAVFPNSPSPLMEAPELHVFIDGDSATLENGVDKWRFIRRDGRWWIAELMIDGETLRG